MRKNGNQHKMKTPTTIPNVLAAFFSRLNLARRPAKENMRYLVKRCHLHKTRNSSEALLEKSRTWRVGSGCNQTKTERWNPTCVWRWGRENTMSFIWSRVRRGLLCLVDFWSQGVKFHAPMLNLLLPVFQICVFASID